MAGLRASWLVRDLAGHHRHRHLHLHLHPLAHHQQYQQEQQQLALTPKFARTGLESNQFPPHWRPSVSPGRDSLLRRGRHSGSLTAPPCLQPLLLLFLPRPAQKQQQIGGSSGRVLSSGGGAARALARGESMPAKKLKKSKRSKHDADGLRAVADAKQAAGGKGKKNRLGVGGEDALASSSGGTGSSIGGGSGISSGSGTASAAVSTPGRRLQEQTGAVRPLGSSLRSLVADAAAANLGLRWPPPLPSQTSFSSSSSSSSSNSSSSNSGSGSSGGGGGSRSGVVRGSGVVTGLIPPTPHTLLLPGKRLHAHARVIIIGDVHGCYEEMEALLEKCGKRPDDVVVFVGDLVNKGPDSAAVLRAAREMGALGVRGNHDHKIIAEAAALGPGATIRSSRLQWLADVGEEDLAWLRSLPLTLRIPSHACIVVHAGLVPGVPLHQQYPDNLMNMRFVRPRDRKHQRAKRHRAQHDDWDEEGEGMELPMDLPWWHALRLADARERQQQEQQQQQQQHLLQQQELPLQQRQQDGSELAHPNVGAAGGQAQASWRDGSNDSSSSGGGSSSSSSSNRRSSSGMGSMELLRPVAPSLVPGRSVGVLGGPADHALDLAGSSWATPVPTPMGLRAPFVGPSGIGIGSGSGSEDDDSDGAQSRIRSSRTSVSGGSRWAVCGERDEDSRLWAREWVSAWHVVFGHDAVRGVQLHRHATGLDSGCVYGGRLTALVLPSMAELQARSGKHSKEAAAAWLQMRWRENTALVSVPAGRTYEPPKR